MELLSLKKRNLVDKDYFRQIIATTEFQRLRKISFLGAIDYSLDANPLDYEERSRFSHCINVSKLAYMISQYKKYPPDVEKHLVIAALLHDIGHMPLSHSIERDVKKHYGIDHHKLGCAILKGKSPLGKKLFTILQRYVDIDEIINLINGESSYPGNEIFSNPINIDTIDGITRAANYLNWNVKKLTAEKICLNAFNLENNSSLEYVDNFWKLKGEIYSKLILNKKGLLADHLSGSYFLENSRKFVADDLYEDEMIWEEKHPGLFLRLRSQHLINENDLSSVRYFARSYVIDEAQSGSDRYIYSKQEETLSFLREKFSSQSESYTFHFNNSENRSFVYA